VDGPAPPASRHSFETRLLLIFAGIVVAGLLALSLIRLREETVSFDLATGAMRIDRYIGGFQYASEPVESYLGWIAALEPRPSQWVALSERHDGSLLRGPRYQRRIGLVHLDACVLAQALFSRDVPRLRQTIREIAAAGSERIWSLRQDLRTEFDRRRQSDRTVDRRPGPGTTTPCPATR
jgi:hypothetical protein